MPNLAAERRSVLQGLSLHKIGGSVTVADAGLATRFAYRGVAAALDAFGVALPQQPCRAVAGNNRAALWLGPDEWLLIAPAAESASLLRSLKCALADKPASLVDVSHRNIGLIVEGPRAMDLLNTGCPLDLDPEAFPVGMCARTLLGKVEIVLWRFGWQAFRLEAGRSFAPYLAGLLDEAARDLPPPTVREPAAMDRPRVEAVQ
jgi:sarcosine oxidase subunit gamma